MADNSKQLLVVLDKFQDRVAELVVVTATAKNIKAAESSKDSMDMKTFISRTFSTKTYVNIFDAATEEWLWKTNPKVTHIHKRCLELWGQDEVEKEELKEEELEEEEEPAEEAAEEVASDDSEAAEESAEEEEPAEEPQDLFAAARQAVANRKAKDSSTSKPSTKNADSSKPSKKVEKPSEEVEEEKEVESEEANKDTKKSGTLVAIVGIVIAILAAIACLTFNSGKELETLGFTAQYTEATNKLNQEVKPAWWRWEKWDREVAAEATLTWGPYFRALYVTGEGTNPTSNSVQLYAVYLTLEVLTSQGLEPGEALRVIREEGSETIIAALKSGNISSQDISFIREYLMK